MFKRHIHGERKAEDLATMISSYGPELMTFVGRIVTIQEDTEDVVQETFVSAYKHLDDYNPEMASMKTWLHRIAYHEALYHLRQRKRMFQIPLDVGEDIPDELPDTTTAEQLDEAIQRLTPEDQMLLQLYYFDQRPLKEIAYITETKGNSLEREVSRLSSQLHRIRQKLRMILISMNDEAR